MHGGYLSMKDATNSPVRRTVTDGVWLAVAVGVPIGFLWNLYRAVEREWRGAAGWGIVRAGLVYGVFAVGVAWLTLGAWRRTSWHRRRITGPPG